MHDRQRDICQSIRSQLKQTVTLTEPCLSKRAWPFWSAVLHTLKKHTVLNNSLVKKALPATYHTNIR